MKHIIMHSKEQSLNRNVKQFRKISGKILEIDIKFYYYQIKGKNIFKIYFNIL
jgi:hypothetical protein